LQNKYDYVQLRGEEQVYTGRECTAEGHIGSLWNNHNQTRSLPKSEVGCDSSHAVLHPMLSWLNRKSRRSS